MLDRICPDWESDSNVHIRREGCRRRLKNKTREIDGKPTISTQPCKSKHSFPSIVPHYHTLLLSTPIIPRSAPLSHVIRELKPNWDCR